MGVSLPAGPAWLRSPLLLQRFALASVVVNVLIVVTGGAVRLTGSGLGCPTWPSCTDDSLVPTKKYAGHGIIEFTNRQLTWVVSVVVLATLIIAIKQRTERALAVVLAATIPAQAVLGGISVLTHLNPWVVAAHFLLSSVIIAIAFTLWWRVTGLAGSSRDLPTRSAPRSFLARCSLARSSSQPPLRSGSDQPAEPASSALRLAGWAMTAVTAAVLAVGTVVTGSGPHAGDKGATHRIHFAPASVAQLHADLVMLLIGVTVGFVVLARAAGAGREVERAGWWLLAIELAQGLIGFVQYFTHVPAVLVGIHMFGACLVWLAALTVIARLGAGPFRCVAAANSTGSAAPAPASIAAR